MRLADSESDESITMNDEERWIKRLEEMGPAEARRLLETGRLSEFKRRITVHWLAEFDRALEAASEADASALAREANDIARSSNKIAEAANALASRANTWAMIATAAAVIATAVSIAAIIIAD